MENKVIKWEVVNTFKGHIIHCLDEDSRDEFNVEVLINEKVEQDKLIDICYKFAAKDELVVLSGNSFSYEYLQESGKIVKIIKTEIREVLSPISKESEELLEQRHMD